MQHIVNKFGEGDLHEFCDIKPIKIHDSVCRQPMFFMSCAACTSVYSDILSYAEYSPYMFCEKPEKADCIIVFSCQVTDLAILNDFHIALFYKKAFPDKRIFIGGCLAKRFDIPIPEGIERFYTPRANYANLSKENRDLVTYEKPFWVKNFVDDERMNVIESATKKIFADGSLFRYMYPLNIGSGCSKNCSYCTIKHTRENIVLDDYNKIEKLFVDNENVFIVADSISEEQLRAMCKISARNLKKISFRNIEPNILIKCMTELTAIAKLGLLNIIHCPIQSMQAKVLTDMNRSYANTMEAIGFMKMLKEEYRVFIATNVISNYKDFKQDFDDVYKTFDYVSENPYWDGVWDYNKAIERYNKFIN